MLNKTILHKINITLFKISMFYDLEFKYFNNTVKEIEYYILRKNDIDSIYVEVTHDFVYILINNGVEKTCALKILDEIKIDFIFKKARLCEAYDFEGFLHRLEKILKHTLEIQKKGGK